MFVKFQSFQPTAQSDCFVWIDPEQVQAVMDTFNTGPAGGKLTVVYLVDRDQAVLLKEEAEQVQARLDSARST